jgi:hypothetical protein
LFLPFQQCFGEVSDFQEDVYFLALLRTLRD